MAGQPPQPGAAAYAAVTPIRTGQRIEGPDLGGGGPEIGGSRLADGDPRRVARDLATLEELRAELGGSFTAVPADAADPTMAGQLINAYHPRILVPPRALAR